MLNIRIFPYGGEAYPRPIFQDSFDLLTKMRRGIKRPLRRALTETSKVIRAEVKKRYTYRGAIKMLISAGTRELGGGMGGSIVIKDKRNAVERFNLRRPKRRSYLTVHFLRTKATVFKTGFYWANRGTYYKRLYETRFPVSRIEGPSTAEMAGKEPQPARAIEYAMYYNLEKYLSQYIGEVL